MKLNVTFKQQNPEFDKDYADQYNDGREGPGNMKDKWMLRMGQSGEIDKVAITDKGELSLPDPEGKRENLVLNDMTILEAIKDNETVGTYAVSRSLLQKTHQAHNSKYNTKRFYFYLDPEKSFVRIGNSIYVTENELPELPPEKG